MELKLWRSKTVRTAVAGVFIAAGGYMLDEVDIVQFAEVIWFAIMAVFGRSAINKLEGE